MARLLWVWWKDLLLARCKDKDTARGELAGLAITAPHPHLRSSVTSLQADSKTGARSHNINLESLKCQSSCSAADPNPHTLILPSLLVAAAAAAMIQNTITVATTYEQSVGGLQRN